MTQSDPRRKRIETFSRRLDARLNADSSDPDGGDEALSAEDRAALDLALRLAALNPSLESRGRYPLRRRLLAQAQRHNQRPTPWLDSLRSLLLDGLRPAAGLSMTLALVFIFSWVVAGVNFSAGSGQAMTPTAYQIPQALSLTDEPLPPAVRPIRPGFSPQPIPTPAAPGGNSTGTRTIRDTGQPYQTPAQTGRQAPPVSASPVIP